MSFHACTLVLEWTLIPKRTPEPRLYCSGCRSSQPYKNSNRFRLNANGKRLDAWLIYRCTSCDATWNRPIFERMPVKSIDPALHSALQNNDPDVATRIGFDVEGLKRFAKAIDTFADYDLQSRVQEKPDASPKTLHLHIKVPFPLALRLDRFLAGEFGISRNALEGLADKGSLCLPSGKIADALRRPVKDGMLICVDVERCGLSAWFEMQL
jgi:hypothetical protein